MPGQAFAAMSDWAFAAVLQEVAAMLEEYFLQKQDFESDIRRIGKFLANMQAYPLDLNIRVIM
jgi:hypothetical protein